MIIFSLDPHHPDVKSLRQGAFELGCRMGGDFSVVTDLRDVPSHATIIRHGVSAPGDQRVVLEIPASKEPPRAAVVDGFKLWASGCDGMDVLAGAADLVTGRVDRDVRADQRDRFGCVLPQFHPLSEAGLLQEPLLKMAPII